MSSSKPSPPRMPGGMPSHPASDQNAGGLPGALPPDALPPDALPADALPPGELPMGALPGGPPSGPGSGKSA